MRTHHGRPGGRAGELAVLFLLLALSAALLAADACLWMRVSTWLIIHVGAYISVVINGTIFVASMWVLRRLWSGYLRYYKYEAHTLRPLDDRENTG